MQKKGNSRKAGIKMMSIMTLKKGNSRKAGIISRVPCVDHTMERLTSAQLHLVWKIVNIIVTITFTFTIPIAHIKRHFSIVITRHQAKNMILNKYCSPS